MCVQGLLEPEEGIRIPSTRVSYDCDLLFACWELNLNSSRRSVSASNQMASPENINTNTIIQTEQAIFRNGFETMNWKASKEAYMGELEGRKENDVL